MPTNGAPTPSSPIPTVPLTDYTVAALSEILSLCEEFLRTAGPAVHAELRGYLACQHPPADPTWLIDMLGFHAVHLHHQLPTSAPSPRENHQPRNDHVDPVTSRQMTSRQVTSGEVTR